MKATRDSKRLRDRLRAGGALMGAVFLGRRTPLAVSYIITNRCNYTCAYCNRWRKKGTELTTAQIVDMFRQLKQLGTRFMQITGGEPFLRPDLLDVVREAKACGFFVGVNTNGSLMDRCPQVLDYVDQMTFSLDGPAEVHEKIRPLGSFAAAMRAIDTAQAHGVRVQINTTLTEYNTRYVDRMIDLAEERGVSISFQPASVQLLSGDADNPVAGQRAGIVEGLERIERRRKNSECIKNSKLVLKFMKRWPYRQGLSCAGRYLFYRIESNGDVMVCGRSEVQGAHPPNILEAGVKPALSRVPKPACDTCYNVTRLQVNVLFSLLRANRRVLGGLLRKA